ncbi:hypothetical protein ABPG72_001062 [Tetrahymena utriculariae]
MLHFFNHNVYQRRELILNKLKKKLAHNVSMLIELQYQYLTPLMQIFINKIYPYQQKKYHKDLLQQLKQYHLNVYNIILSLKKLQPEILKKQIYHFFKPLLVHIQNYLNKFFQINENMKKQIPYQHLFHVIKKNHRYISLQHLLLLQPLGLTQVQELNQMLTQYHQLIDQLQLRMQRNQIMNQCHENLLSQLKNIGLIFSKQSPYKYLYFIPSNQ